jgi:D-aspartate ligase
MMGHSINSPYLTLSKSPIVVIETPATPRFDTSTPVVVLASLISGHGIARSLGRLGIPVFGVYDSRSVAVPSRYWKEILIWNFPNASPAATAAWLLELGRKIGSRPLLIPTTDHHCVFVSDYAALLNQEFRLAEQPTGLAASLSNKQLMYQLCHQHAIATPETFFPQNRDELLSILKHLRYPVAIKGVDSWALRQRNGVGVVVVNDAECLLQHYDRLETPGSPNLMLQAYVPGVADARWMFNGYFDERSMCLFGLTGKKLRQNPPAGGMTSLGECETNLLVARKTEEFMWKVGYRGLLDVDFIYDSSRGEYTLLDVNPRIGASFRLFVDARGMDVVRSAYLHLTGQPVPAAVPREGRKWIVENYDAVTSFKYWRKGELSALDWIRSFRGVEEGSWFAWDDPLPFLAMVWRLMHRRTPLLRKRGEYCARVVSSRA